jgi:hypothetical protein
MNSRDAAYDEDEMLRRAIEESRESGSLGKRTRDDSEEYAFDPTQGLAVLLTAVISIKTNSKRRRTSSDSLSPSKATPSPSQAVSDDESTMPNASGANGVKRIRGATVRNHRDKEVRDRQKELAQQRAEAASKRNARSERRRGDGKFSAERVPTLESASF